MAQIWPKFGRILLPQHFPPLCWEGRGDRDISRDGCFELRLTAPAIKLPSLMTQDHQKLKRRKAYILRSETIWCGHFIPNIFTFYNKPIIPNILIWFSPSSTNSCDTQLFLCPVLGNIRQIWLFMVKNIGGDIWVIANPFEHIKLPHFGCWENISQNIINLWKRGEASEAAVGNCCSRSYSSHFSLETLQALVAHVHFEMKSLKIRDLLHLCQSSLGIIERNNLPNASLVENSRNLSGPASAWHLILTKKWDLCRKSTGSM